MKIFLIDFENVHSDGIAGVDSLSENDEVAIFYSNNADSITFEMMHKLMFSKAKLSYYKVKRGGKNALDFQMSSYLGYLINTMGDKCETCEFYLISKDSGFDFVIDFWESGNVSVKTKIKRFYNIKATFATHKPRQLVRPVFATEITEPAKTIIHADKEEITETDEIKQDVQQVEQFEQADAVKAEGDAVVEITPAPAPEPKIKPLKRPYNKKPAKLNPINPIITIKKEMPVAAEQGNAAKDETIIDDLIEVTEPTVPVAEPQSENDNESLETKNAIEKLLSESKSSHELYIGTVKRFGQKKGVEIYREIKGSFSNKKLSAND